jgi:ATP adenylyltransferase
VSTDPGAHSPAAPPGGAEGEEATAGFAGQPDGFERLWTPHRMVYINDHSRPSDDSSLGCPFCQAPQQPDADSLIVHRGRAAYVVLNLYPYSPGHLLVCPYRHVAAYADLTSQETVEVATLTQTAIRVLGEVSTPRGFNVGMNQGEVAGAGIAAHLHQHVVPRWHGDANFLPIIAQTKAVPMLLGETRLRLAAAWPAELAEPGGTDEPADREPGGQRTDGGPGTRPA